MHDRHQHAHREHHQRGVDRIGEWRATDRIQESAYGRTDHGRELPRTAAPGDRVGEQLSRHEFCRERLTRRLQKGARQAAQHDHRVDRGQPRARQQLHAQRPRTSEDPERRAARHQYPERHDRDAPAVVPVGYMPRVQRHADRRQRLGEPDHAERERVPGEVIDLPPHHRALDLDAQREGEQADDVPRELGVPQRRVRVAAHQRGAELSHGRQSRWVAADPDPPATPPSPPRSDARTRPRRRDVCGSSVRTHVPGTGRRPSHR